MNDALKQLWDSTYELPRRFSLRVSDDAQMRKFFEEVYEFTKAIELGSIHARHEAVDVLVTMMLRMQLQGVTYEDFERAVMIVIDKNDAKTPETHCVIDGMIKRKVVKA